MANKRTRRAKPISSKAELAKELGVTSLPKIVSNPAAEAKLIQLAPDIAPELLAEVFRTVPELTKGFSQLIASMGDIGKSLEETKRHRWDVFKELAKSGKMSADQILEAMRIIADIEKTERIDWTEIFKLLPMAIGVIVAGILIAVGLGKSDTSVGTRA